MILCNLRGDRILDSHDMSAGIFIFIEGGGAEGALPPLDLTTQKGPKFGMYSIYGYLLNLFLMFCEIVSGPLSHVAYRKVHNFGPFNEDTCISEPCVLKY